MKVLLAWLALVILTIGLKLFTYEFYLADDPTSGVAARMHPSLINHQILRSGDAVLFSTENDFPGSMLYQALVAWGYFAVLVAGVPVLMRYSRSRRRRSFAA